MTHAEVCQVLEARYPASEWSYIGDGSSLDDLAWHDDSTAAPTLADLEAALTAVQLAAAVKAKQAVIEAALSATDWWDARAYAEQTTIPQDRVDYRNQLRTIWQQTAAATDLATVEAITLPDVPAYTPPS